MTPVIVPSIHRFLDFELDEIRIELRHAGVPVTTQARVFSLLKHLVRNRERVVTKNELIEQVWQCTLVSETAISQTVMLARKALADHDHRLIRTVRGHGYCLTVPPAIPVAPPESLAPPAVPRGGREPELRSLMVQVARAQQRQHSLVLVDGEPGVGKSWLLEALAVRAAEHGGRVLWCKSAPTGPAPALWPWVEVLRELLTPLGSAATLREQLGAGFDEALALLPELAIPASADNGTPQYGFRACDALARLLRKLLIGLGGTTQTSLLLLDDLQSFDAGSLQVLQLLAQRAHELPLLAVATYSSLRPLHGEALRALLANLPEGSCQLHLAGLDPLTLHELLAGERLLSADWVSYLHETTRGNPALFMALATPVRASKVWSSRPPHLPDVKLPERILSTVREALATLPAAAREMLTVAAVLEPVPSLPLLAHLAGRAESVLLVELAPALAAGLLSSSPDQPSQLSFSHAAVRCALYLELLPTTRAAHHRAAGDYLTTIGRAPEAAPHFLLSALVGPRDQTTSRISRAAEQALARRDFAEAARLYDHAVELAQLDHELGSACRELLLLSGEALYQLGRQTEALERFVRAERLALAAGDAELAARAVGCQAFAQRIRILFDRSLQQRLRDRFADDETDEGQHGAIVLSLRVLADDGCVLARERLARRAVEAARKTGDLRLLGKALHARQIALAGHHTPAMLRAEVDELVDCARRSKDYELLLDALLSRMGYAGQLGDLAGSVRDAVEYWAVIEAWSSPFHSYLSATRAAGEATMAGSFALGAKESLRARELGSRWDPGADTYHNVRTLLAHVLYGFGDSTVCELGFDDVPSDYRPFWCLAWLRDGRSGDAERVLASYAHGGFSQPMIELLRLPIWVVLSELSAQLCELNVVRTLYPLLAKHDGTHVLMHASVYLGPVSYYLALLAAAEGRDGLAERHFNEAITQASALCALPFVARIRHAQALWLRRGGANSQRAGELLRSAKHLARGLGVVLAD